MQVQIQIVHVDAPYLNIRYLKSGFYNVKPCKGSKQSIRMGRLKMMTFHYVLFDHTISHRTCLGFVIQNYNKIISGLDDFMVLIKWRMADDEWRTDWTKKDTKRAQQNLQSRKPH